MQDSGPLKKILIVSKYTWFEIIKSKILFNIFIMGLFLLLATFVAFQFSYGNPMKVALDIGLGALTLSSVGIAIFFGATLLPKEIEQRTIHMIISRPVSRWSFYLGKMLGLSVVLFVNIFILSFLTLGIYFLYGGEWNTIILHTVMLTFIESLLVLALVSFFSLLTSPTLSVLLTITLYIVGHGMGEVGMLTFVQERPVFQMIIKIYTYLLPAFYQLNIKDYLLYDQLLETLSLFKSYIHGIFYTLFLITLGAFIIEKKDLS